jgi:hypothetical protein
MIISFQKIDDDSGNPSILYMCTNMSFERMLDEVKDIRMEDISFDDGIGCYDDTEPFLLDHIYLN